MNPLTKNKYLFVIVTLGNVKFILFKISLFYERMRKIRD